MTCDGGFSAQYPMNPPSHLVQCFQFILFDKDGDNQNLASDTKERLRRSLVIQPPPVPMPGVIPLRLLIAFHHCHHYSINRHQQHCYNHVSLPLSSLEQAPTLSLPPPPFTTSTTSTNNTAATTAHTITMETMSK